MQGSPAIDQRQDPPTRPRRGFARELFAWGVIGLIALGAFFIQSCPDPAQADDLNDASFPPSGPWAAIFNCPIHQAFIVPAGGTGGS
jgi:hypothetical protein